MDAPSVTLRATTAAAIGSAFWLSGGMSSISVLSVPATTLAPSEIIARQFKSMYTTGRITQPPATLLTTLLFFYVSRQNYLSRNTLGDGSGPETWKLYAAAGTAVGLTLPYTFGLMERVSHRLLALAEPNSDAARLKGSEDALVLMKRWGFLNSVRSLFPLIGGVLGIWATLR